MAGTRGMSYDDRRELRKLAAQSVANGAEPRLVARGYGMSVGWIEYSCREFNITTQRVRKRPRALKILHRLLYTNETTIKIAGDEGITTASVAGILKEARLVGFRFPHRQDRKGTEKQVEEQRREESWTQSLSKSSGS